MKLSRIVLTVFLFLLLIVVLELFTTDLGSGCPSSFLTSVFTAFDPDLEKEYEKSKAIDCGFYNGKDKGNETELYNCLQQNLDSCAESKALIQIQGIETRYSYLYETTSNCEVKLSYGACGVSKKKVKEIIRYQEI